MAENTLHELKTCPTCGSDDIIVERDSLGQEFCICMGCIEMWLKPGGAK